MNYIEDGVVVMNGSESSLVSEVNGNQDTDPIRIEFLFLSANKVHVFLVNKKTSIGWRKESVHKQ